MSEGFEETEPFYQNIRDERKKANYHLKMANDLFGKGLGKSEEHKHHSDMYTHHNGLFNKARYALNKKIDEINKRDKKVS